MKIHHLEYFQKLACLEHYHQASRELKITQPTLSYAITELEKELGVALFERVGRNVRLTKYGHIYLEHVDKALNTLKKGRQVLAELSCPTVGHISLGFAHSCESPFLAEIVTRYGAENGGAFTLHQEDTDSLLKRLLVEEVDLVLTPYQKLDGRLEFTPLFSQRWVCLVCRSHPFTKREEVTLQEVAQEPLLFDLSRPEMQGQITQLFAEKELAPRYVAEVSSDELREDLVAAGYGIAFGPEPVVGTLPKADRSVLHIPVLDMPLEQQLYLVTLSSHSLTPATAKFREFVLNSISSTGITDHPAPP